MPRSVGLPEEQTPRADGTFAGGWWHETDEPGKLICDLCPRACHLKPGDRGFCFVRENRDGEMLLTTYGRSTGFCIDPIEKKPLNHFFPNTSVLSFGTAGCNLGCKFCQNWDISKSREIERLSEQASPAAIAEAAAQLGCRSVAFTYNDPVIWAEYAIDCAAECRARGVHPVAVTAGYITPQARPTFFHAMDAANVDLKSFSEEFYYRITYSHLQPVLETLEWLKRETDVWFEITNLVIPDANDSPDELRQMCQWILAHVGDDTPVHFTAFHPDFRMRDKPNTPLETLLSAHEIAGREGLKFVYVGNVHDTHHQSTFCPSCGHMLIERDWYQIGRYGLNRNQCEKCGTTIPGHFDDAPGNWGGRRQPVRISDYRTAGNLSSQPPETYSIMTESPSQPGSSASQQRPSLNEHQQARLHQVACDTVALTLQGYAPPPPAEALGELAGTEVMGAFVTLKRQDRLRACCGTLGHLMPLGAAVQHAATRTATEDLRLPPISVSELPYLNVEVSLLHNIQGIPVPGQQRVEHVEIGRHGLIIRRGQQSGLLLPVVAVEHGFEAEEFLRQVCVKAGLPVTAWSETDTQLQTFETKSISGSFQATVPVDISRQAFTRPDIEKLAHNTLANLALMLQGATPNYYLPDCVDGTVQGLSLAINTAGSDAPRKWSRVSMRPGLPLQSTLYAMCQTAVEALSAERLENVSLDLAVLYDSAMHGSASTHDLQGLEPGQRALMITDAGHHAWQFDADQPSAEALLDGLFDGLRLTNPDTASLISFAIQSTRSPMAFNSFPRAQRGTSVRPPAVAGTFYPQDADQLNQMVDAWLTADEPPAAAWPAAIVPHAGLQYSGRIAAKVLRRITIPDTVIVLGPKHTRLGVPWAVAPHDSWALPNGRLASDPQLAQELVQHIDGWELDAEAHRQEHAVEVELPILVRLAPDTKVVGVALGPASWEQCCQFAADLARLLEQRATRPLLLVSSDMNHFATDAENRRLDRMALDAMNRLDPAHLYDTVIDNRISMCGIVPAVIVMETLRQLGCLNRVEQVDYATSADVSGDTSRVVGYAGALLGM